MSHVDHPATGREKLGLHRLAVSSAESRYRTRHPWRRYEFDFVDVTTRPWSATVFMESADGERIDRNEVHGLEVRFAAAVATGGAPELHLRADRGTRYERVTEVLATAQKSGLVKIAFVTEPAR